MRRPRVAHPLTLAAVLAPTTLRAAAQTLVVLALGVAAWPAAAHAAAVDTSTPAAPAVAAPVAGPSGPDLSVRAEAIADEVVRRWASVQGVDGRFPDPIYGAGGDYGTAMLGYAMLRRGEEEGDKALIRGGLDAIQAQVDIPAGGAFELLVLARAYRWADGALPSDPIAAPMWAKAAPKLAADLAARGPVTAQTAAATCYADARCYNNLKLVSSLASLELEGTGIKAAKASALLADPGLRGRVLHRVGNRVPKEVGNDIERDGDAPLDGGGLLSDPPRNPFAYHALSTLMLGEIIDELGDDAPPAAIKAYDRVSKALLMLAAPDGDVTYFGRGQGQVWVPAVVAAAAARAAEHQDSAALRGRFLALAEASLTRIRSVYGVGANGLPLVPGAVDAVTLASRRVDPYATTRGYNGLAVFALDRAAATLKRVAGTATRVPSQRPGVVVSPKQAGVTTITRGSLWAAVGSKTRAPEDARYASGLLALQQRDAAGDWHPIVPGRPYNPQRVGTLAVKVGGRTLVAAGDVTGTAGSSVTIKGGWSQPGEPKTLVDNGTRWRWTVEDPRTISVSFVAKSDRTVVLNALMGDGASLRKVPFGLLVTGADGGALQYSLGVGGRRLDLRREARPAGGSAYDSALAVAQARALVRKGERVTMKIRVVSRAPDVTGGG